MKNDSRRMPQGRGRFVPAQGKFNKETFKKLLKYFKKYRILLIVVIFCILGNSIIQVQSQLFLSSLIDDYITPLLLTDNPVFTSLLHFICFMACLYLGGILCNFTYNQIMVYISQGILKDIRNDLFSKMETLPISYFDTHSHGDIMSVYTNDIDTLRQMISQSIPALLGSVFSIITIFISMLTLNIPLTLVVIIGIVIMVLITKNVASKSGNYFIKGQEALGKLNGYIEEMITGQKVIKVFTHEEESKEEFQKLNDNLCEVSSKANGYGNIMGPITNNVGNLIYVVIAFVGSLIAMNTSTFTLGAIVSFLALTKSFTHPIMQVTQQFNSIVMALAGAERIFDLMEEKPEENTGTVSLVYVKEENNKLRETNEYTGLWAWKKGNELIPLKGDIRFNDVYFSYVKGKTVLSDVSLFARPGEKIAFVGSTGAGKTTITNLLNRFYDIDSGSITYDGIDIKDINKKDLRISLGMVLQDTNLFTGTIMENIRYGRDNATDEECINAAHLANADTFIEKFPDGYNTIINDNGSNLSQGQKQLLAIARCAVANPPVMILDEATSSIDTRTEKIVQEGMDKIMKGRTVFVIAHRLSTIQNSEAILVLEHGKIIERGEHEELLKLKGKYYGLYTGAVELD